MRIDEDSVESHPADFEVGGGASVPPEGPKPPGRMDRTRFSVASLESVNELDLLELQISKMKVSSEDAEKVLGGGGGASSIPTGMRNELCQLHGNLNKLLATRLDAILTGDLNSGRDAARAQRKELIKKTESLIEVVEDQVKRLDKMKG